MSIYKSRREIYDRIKLLERNALENSNNYNAKSITRAQYIIRRKDVNGRMSELRGELRDFTQPTPTKKEGK